MDARFIIEALSLQSPCPPLSKYSGHSSVATRKKGDQMVSTRSREIARRVWLRGKKGSVVAAHAAKWIGWGIAVGLIYYLFGLFSAEVSSDDMFFLVFAKWIFLLILLLYTAIAAVLALKALWQGTSIAGPITGEPLASQIGRQLLLAVGYLVVGGLFAMALLAHTLVTISGLPEPWAQDAVPTYNQTVALFAWHTTDLVPLADLPATLRWEEPVQARGLMLSLPLALYKVMVLSPALAVLAGVLQRKGKIATLSEVDTTDLDVS